MSSKFVGGYSGYVGGGLGQLSHGGYVGGGLEQLSHGSYVGGGLGQLSQTSLAVVASHYRQIQIGIHKSVPFQQPLLPRN